MSMTPDQIPPSAPLAVDAGPLLEAIEDAAAVIDAGGVVRLHNQRFEQLLSSPATPRLPLGLGEGGGELRLSAEGLEGAERSCFRGIREVLRGARARFETILPDGEAGAGRWAISAVTTRVDGAGGALMIARDLAPSPREVHLMRCAEVVEAMQLGLHVYQLEDLSDDQTLRVVQVNPASHRITGLREADLIGGTIDENYPDVRPRNLAQFCVDVVRNQRPVEMEELFEDRTSGRKLTFAIKVFPLSSQCVGAIFENITKRRAIEASLERTKRFLDSIIDNIPIVIFIKDAQELRYVRVNKYMDRVLGRRWEDVVGKTDHEVFSAEVADGYVAVDREALARGEIVSLPDDISEVEGQGKRVFRTRKVPIYDAAGEPLYVLGVSEDVTDQRAAEEANRRESVLLETQVRLLELVQELSTPLLPVHEGILVAPLVGQVDAARGAHFMEALLSGIERHGAETVLIDVTGVPMIDAGVAAQLVQATRAAGLLGTTCALVGVSSEVARALVELGVDLGELRTHRDLRAGILAALGRRGAARAVRTGGAG